MDIVSDVALSGMVAQYGRGTGLIQGVATQLVSEFSSALRGTLAERSDHAESGSVSSDVSGHKPLPSAEPKPQAAKSISGLSLIMKVIWAAIVGVFRSK